MVGTKPDVGTALEMDNIGKLSVRLLQGTEEKIDKTENEKLILQENVEQNFGDVFTRPGTVGTLKAVSNSKMTLFRSIRKEERSQSI